MPNGHDREWRRLCSAADGFFHRYQRWPTELQMSTGVFQQLQELFTPQDFALLCQKVTLVTVPGTILLVAADSSGARYCYNEEGPPDNTPSPSARQWFGITPLPEEYP